MLAIKRACFSVVLAASFVGIPAMAQEPHQYLPMQVPLPATLLQASCTQSNYSEDSFLALTCLAERMLEEPTVAVTMVVNDERPSLEQISEQIRDSFHETGLRRIVREEEFSPLGFPEIVGMRGVYSTNLGLRRTWAIWHDGVYIRVLVTILSEEADGDYEDEIMEAVFGPERFSEQLEGEAK